MKTAKILLGVLVACSLTAGTALAQGRIAFANTGANRLYIGYTGDPNSLTVLGTASTASFGIGPASVQIRLYAGLTSSSLQPVLIGTAANQEFVLNTASTIAAAQGTFAGGSNLVLPGFDGSAPVFLQMRCESINGLFFGLSPIIQVVPAVGVAVATPVFGPPGTPDAWDGTDSWGSLGGLIRIGIPEPSALALTGLSFGVMFLARRRK